MALFQPLQSSLCPYWPAYTTENVASASRGGASRSVLLLLKGFMLSNGMKSDIDNLM